MDSRSCSSALSGITHLIQGISTPAPVLPLEVEVHAGSAPSASVGLEASMPPTPHILHGPHACSGAMQTSDTSLHA